LHGRGYPGHCFLGNLSAREQFHFEGAAEMISDGTAETTASEAKAKQVRAQVCIAGGGPAGMMLGLLLARAGIDTIVLEKHADFLRDFRGDTIHPSTLEVMNELGFFDELLALPHQKAQSLSGKIGAEMLPLADFTHLPTRAKFIAFMPQWHFLDFLAGKAAAYPTFRLLMRAEVQALISEDGTVAGVVAETPPGEGSRCAPVSQSAPTDGIQPCVKPPASSRKTSARPWTCSGSG